MDLARDLDPGAFRARAQECLSAARAARSAFVGLPGETPGEQVVEAFDAIRRPLDAVRGSAHLLSQTHPEAAVREAGLEVVREVAAFETELIASGEWRRVGK